MYWTGAMIKKNMCCRQVAIAKMVQFLGARRASLRDAVWCGNDIRLSPSAAEVLDEGEGLEDLGHDGVEEPVDVGADIGHRLRISFILRFAALRGSVLRLRFWCWDWWPAHINFGVRCPLDFGALSPGLWCIVPWTLLSWPRLITDSLQRDA